MVLLRLGCGWAPAACIERSRELLGQELAALVGESYERAYQNMVRVQQLTELEETIDYSLSLTLAQGAPSLISSAFSSCQLACCAETAKDPINKAVL